jgi:hypothetical protein
MDLSLYRLLIQHLTPPPDLSLVKQEGHLLAEEWPVVLDKIITYRKQVQHFTVTDGKSSVMVVSDVPDLYERITATEIGTIIHLLGAKVAYNQQHKTYVVHVEDFATLKQYDEHLREVREAEARRRAELELLNQELAYHDGSY